MEQVTDNLSRLPPPLSLLFPLSCQASPCLSSPSVSGPESKPRRDREKSGSKARDQKQERGGEARRSLAGEGK